MDCESERKSGEGKKNIINGGKSTMAININNAISKS